MSATSAASRIIGWGSNGRGQATAPAGLSNVVAISAGQDFSLALKEDGAVVAWGVYSDGLPFPPDLTNAVGIGSGFRHALALKSDGTIVGWGYGENGQASAPAGLSNVASIAVGAYHNLALKSNGTVVAWGSNNHRETNVPAGLSNVTVIAAGGVHSLALKRDGAIVTWGRNVPIPADLTNVVAVAAGQAYSLALRLDRTVVAWGDNSVGQTNVPAGLTNVVAIDAGGSHSLALREDGTVFAWGDNYWGQTNVPPGLSNVVAIAAGWEHSLVLTNSNNSPVFVRQPASQTSYSGRTVTLNAAAVGFPPLSYQWRFNGTNISGATNSYLLLANVQSANTGNYHVMVANVHANAVSSNAALAIIHSPPIIRDQPTGQAVLVGQNVSISLTADGSWPLSYQWQFNGTNIVAATNASLALTNVQLHHEGTYQAVVSNAYGSFTSADVRLNVEELSDLASVLGTAVLPWMTGGDAPWFGQTNIVHEGVAAAQSGGILNNQQSVLQTIVLGPGTLTFWWKVSSNPFHPLVLSANGEERARLAGEIDWHLQTVYIGEGDQNLQWRYSKNSISSAGGDAAWLDEVTYQPGATPATITSFPTNQSVMAGVDVTLSVVAHGTPPLRYQWLFNGSDIDNATNAALILSNVQTNHEGTYSVNVSNAYATALTSNAALVVNSSPPTIWVQPLNRFALPGSNATFSVTVRGSAPLDYQWQFQSNNIAGATMSVLTLTNVQAADTGHYRVVVTNAYGVTRSSNSSLTLIDLLALAEALDGTNLLWSTSENAPWFAQTNTTHDGVDAARSRRANFGAPSILRTTVIGPGTLSFWWRRTSMFDSINFFHPSGGISIFGSGWQQRIFYLPEGSQALRWEFRASSFPGNEQDAGLLDQVNFVPGGTGATVTGASTNRIVPAGMSVTFSATAIGTPPLTYQWRFNGEDLKTATNSSLTLPSAQPLDSGIYTVAVSNAYGVSTTNILLTVQPFQFSLSHSNMHMNSNGFLLSLSGVFATNSVIIHASTDLVNWSPIFTNSATAGSFQILDRTATNLPLHFYRAEEQ